MTFTISISIRCPCGEPVSWPNNVTKNTVITCSKCGQQLGTYADLERQAADETRDRFSRFMNDPSKGF